MSFEHPKGTVAEWKYIITNPPFSLKDQFLARCYELARPFALLLPLTALEGIKRQTMYKEYGVQVLVLPKRPDFEFPGKVYKRKPWVACAWYTWGFNFESDLTFLEQEFIVYANHNPEDWKRFFASYDRYSIDQDGKTKTYSNAAEELYQMFKARLQEECEEK